ncbi:hypothetical protein PSCICJ_06350 [Pseudomonas cichorii]|nr:hypothetical protein PSCICJ_06350 [Pseudomonas cichorii]
MVVGCSFRAKQAPRGEYRSVTAQTKPVGGSLLAKKASKPADILRLYAEVASKLPPTKEFIALK